MSAVVSKKKRKPQSASQATARHSGEDRNPVTTSSQSKYGWLRMPLAEVGEWCGGGTPSKANPLFWENGHIPWVSPKDMKSDVITDTQDHITEEAVMNSATNLVDAGNVLLVARSGILQHTLPVAITSRQVALNQDIKAIKPKKGIRADYLALALKASRGVVPHKAPMEKNAAKLGIALLDLANLFRSWGMMLRQLAPSGIRSGNLPTKTLAALTRNKLVSADEMCSSILSISL